LTRAKPFSLTIATLLVLTLVPSAPLGYAAAEPVEPQGRPTTAAAPPSASPARPLFPAAGATTRVSVASDGSQGNSWSQDSSISADGRYVAFHSDASNLVSGDTNGDIDIFVHDRQTGQTTRVSVGSDGGQGNGWSSRPSISADGRYVAFDSLASNLVSGDTNGKHDVFVNDWRTRLYLPLILRDR